jgi:hypothetical protein
MVTDRPVYAGAAPSKVKEIDMNDTKDAAGMLVKAEALARAIRLLMAAGCQFAIIDAAGAKHGDLEVAEPKKRHYKFPRAELLEYHKPFTAKLEAGQTVTVPFGPYDKGEDRESLRSSISGYCSRVWGNKTYLTAMGADGIELLRVE